MGAAVATSKIARPEGHMLPNALPASIALPPPAARGRVRERLELDHGLESRIRARARATVGGQLGWTHPVLVGSAVLVAAAVVLIGLAVAAPQLPQSLANMAAALVGACAGLLVRCAMLARRQADDEPLLPCLLYTSPSPRDS